MSNMSVTLPPPPAIYIPPQVLDYEPITMVWYHCALCGEEFQVVDTWDPGDAPTCLSCDMFLAHYTCDGAAL